MADINDPDIATLRRSFFSHKEAGKALGEVLGFEGRAGGWIYPVDSRRAVCQGWDELARRYRVVRDEFGFTFPPEALARIVGILNRREEIRRANEEDSAPVADPDPGASTLRRLAKNRPPFTIADAEAVATLIAAVNGTLRCTWYDENSVQRSGVARHFVRSETDYSFARADEGDVRDMWVRFSDTFEFAVKVSTLIDFIKRGGFYVEGR